MQQHKANGTHRAAGHRRRKTTPRARAKYAAICGQLRVLQGVKEFRDNGEPT